MREDAYLGCTRQPITGLADADVEAELLKDELLHGVAPLLLGGLLWSREREVRSQTRVGGRRSVVITSRLHMHTHAHAALIGGNMYVASHTVQYRHKIKTIMKAARGDERNIWHM